MARIKFFNETTGKWEHADSAYSNSKGSGIDVTGAEVGQIIKVSAVDGNGKPTAWEAVDMPKSAQADWNQNDETADDYVKNRPFYTGDPVRTVLLPETDVEFIEEDGEIWADSPPAIPDLTEGSTYTVTWDGVEYECVAVTFDADGEITHGLGDTGLFWGEDSTEEPFGIIVWPEGTWCIILAKTSGTHTISIVGDVVEIRKLDEKYIPKVFTGIDAMNGNWELYRVNSVWVKDSTNTQKSSTDIVYDLDTEMLRLSVAPAHSKPYNSVMLSTSEDFPAVGASVTIPVTGVDNITALSCPSRNNFVQEVSCEFKNNASRKIFFEIRYAGSTAYVGSTGYTAITVGPDGGVYTFRFANSSPTAGTATISRVI